MERNNKGQFIKGENIVDLVGDRYGRLTVLRKSDKTTGRKTYWWCQCECGKVKEIRSDTLRSKTKPVRSCGCLLKEQAIENVSKNHKHKASRTRLYNIWQNMKARCYNVNDSSYDRYGGRGIKIYSEWLLDFSNFQSWARENGYSDELSIERIDVNCDYEPSNCKWIPMVEQANNRRPTIWVEYEGKRLNLKQWATFHKLNYETVVGRYHRGKRPPELFDPVIKR